MKQPKCARFVSLALFLIFPSVASGQTETARPHLQKLNQEQQTLVDRWLRQDCAVGEEGVLEDKLLAIGTPLEATFWEAFSLGPGQPDIDRHMDSARRQYRKQLEWLHTHGNRLFGPEQTQHLLAITEEDYLTKEKKWLFHIYKSRALAGLGLVGTKNSLLVLRKIAADQTQPEHVDATRALEQLRRRGIQ